MQLIILVFCLLVFFFCLYRLGKDDYVFIRKNISMEDLFDIGFLGLLAGIFFARLLFVIFYPIENGNIFMQFFSPRIGTLSLTGVLVGAWIWTYLLGKYKKYPLARIFDFLCLAFSIVLPFGYVGNILFLKKSEFLLNGVLGVIYLILAVLLGKILYPRLMSARLREGTLSTIFLFCFSIITFASSFFTKSPGKSSLFAPVDFFLVGICLLSAILFFRQERKGNKAKK
jgi:prolipoprotein diacylglyceryltransferase